MKITIESDRECTVDGVGLLEPGKPVVVDPVMFMVYHGKAPGQANFPTFIKVTYDTEAEAEGLDEDPTVPLDEDVEEEEEA